MSMMNEHNTTLLKLIFQHIENFRSKKVNIQNLIANLSGNISALEGVDAKFIDRFYGFIGEVDFIEHTEAQNTKNNLILLEVEEYTTYLRQYFADSKL